MGKKINQLYPLPGAKGAKKYHILRSPSPEWDHCEPFMGSAAIPISRKIRSPILGEINPAQRAIAHAPLKRSWAIGYRDSYELARSFFMLDVDWLLIQPFSKSTTKQAQKALRAAGPDFCQELDDRWRILTSDLFRLMISDPNSPKTAGLYSFCQRACFGNVMRLNPKGTAFNVSWHIQKLPNAIFFQPLEWAIALKNQGWNPRISDSWQGAIESIRNPRKAYLLLDPPYVSGPGDRKMTPCYPGHSVTGDGWTDTYDLSIEPLKLGLDMRISLVQLTNYYSPQLDAEITDLAHRFGYLCDRVSLGPCNALGNSNGRLEHGDRRDLRPKPIEYVWTFKPWSQLSLFS